MRSASVRFARGAPCRGDRRAAATRNPRAAGRTSRAHGAENATLVVGDGTEGLAAHAPFDRIVVSAAFPKVPEALAEQLVVGGRLVQPIGPGGHDDVIVFIRRPHGLVALRSITRAHFVRLVGRHGFPV